MTDEVLNNNIIMLQTTILQFNRKLKKIRIISEFLQFRLSIDTVNVKARLGNFYNTVYLDTVNAKIRLSSS